MGRGGITKQMVKKAKADLIAQGLHPSIYAVRIALGGTGSNSTISRYLKELEEPPKTAFDRLSEPLLVLINEISEQLQQEANDKLRAAETKFALEKNQLAEELIEVRSQTEQLKRENSELKLLIQKKQQHKM
ncbi:DNA-binding protein [Pseudomonas viridiflava]|jgi:hypothetical protein